MTGTCYDREKNKSLATQELPNKNRALAESKKAKALLDAFTYIFRSPDEAHAQLGTLEAAQVRETPEDFAY